MKLDETTAVVIHRIKERIHRRLGCIVPERRHRLTKLHFVERAIAVVVPLAKQVDQPDGVLVQDLTQLLLHGNARTSAQLDHSGEYRRALRHIVDVDVLVGQLGGAAAVCLLRAALEPCQGRLSREALAEHRIELLVLE